MDPFDDSEFSDEDLRAVLKKWDAPPAPPSLSPPGVAEARRRGGGGCLPDRSAFRYLWA